MKKCILFALAIGSLMFADDNWGVIEAVNPQEHTITVNKSVIKILPYTKIEEETCMQNGFHGRDVPRTFDALKVGQVVELDFLGLENNVLLAEEVEIKCANRAY